jgi:hypothetical protein
VGEGLVDYLSKPNGVELLNDKLTHKFSKELKQIAKAQDGPTLPSKRDEEVNRSHSSCERFQRSCCCHTAARHLS